MKNITILFNSFGWVEGKENETEKQLALSFSEYSLSGDFMILQCGAIRRVYPLKVIDGFIIAEEDYKRRAEKNKDAIDTTELDEACALERCGIAPQKNKKQNLKK